MQKIYITLIGFFQVTTLFAQQITNISVIQEANNVVINYDLVGGQSGQTHNIEVSASNNNGQSFTIIPISLTGDLKNISTGSNKRIIWNVLNDLNELTGDGFVFKLTSKSDSPASNFSANSGTFNDERDGEVYKLVKMGTKIWMAENLKATKYNDGTAIPIETEEYYWRKLKTGGYCYSENDNANKAYYGALYNWYAVSTNKLCPAEWHVSTMADWKALIDYLGGEDVAGGKLKETGITHWLSPNTRATNTSGFSALPGGFRNGNVGRVGYWWCSTEDKLYSARFGCCSAMKTIYARART